MHILILGASKDSRNWHKKPQITFDYLICADGGLILAEKWGLKPNLVLGDGDSYGRDFPPDLAAINFQTEKDATDSELAIQKALELGATKITLIGFLGGRLDHTLANLFFITALKTVKFCFKEEWGEVYLAEKTTEILGQKGEVISLIPLTESVEGISTVDLKYPLVNETLFKNQTRGISNILVKDKALVRKKRGELLIVHLKEGNL